MAGPFGFTALLRMIHQTYQNFTYQENIREIVQLVKTFENEYEKYNAEFDTLGKRLRSALEQYDSVATTRTRKLTGVIEKIKSEESLPETEGNQLLG